jgi:hypothetical protein
MKKQLFKESNGKNKSQFGLTGKPMTMKIMKFLSRVKSRSLIPNQFNFKG